MVILSDLKQLRKNFAIFSRRGFWSIHCFDCNAKFNINKNSTLGELTYDFIESILEHAALHAALAPKREPEPELEPEPIVRKMPVEFTLMRRPREGLL